MQLINNDPIIQLRKEISRKIKFKENKIKKKKLKFHFVLNYTITIVLLEQLLK